MYRLAIGTYILVFLSTGVHVVVAQPSPNNPTARHEAERLAHLPPVTPNGHIDYTGRSQKGQASYYARRFAGHKTAGGKRFNPNSDIAASKTLPLGSTAMVTNLKTSKSARVKVEDRGPYVNGRVLDVAPLVADRLHLKKSGVAPVVVAPITVPQPDGTVRLGAGATVTNPQRSKSQMGDAH
jgi:rare lipoprotein A